jgi:hypothetical protein
MTGFNYPPFTAVILRPLDALSSRWQELTWLWIALSALVGGAVITARALLPSTWPRARIGILVALTFPPATYNLWHGQINTVIFLLLAIALSDYLTGHRTRCGIILGVAAGIKLAPVVLLVVLIRRGWWRGALAGLATGAARVAAHSVLTVDGPSPWLHTVSTSLSLATLALVVIAVSKRERTTAERGAEFGCAVAAMLLIGSIAWYPVYVHLLIAIAAAVGLAYERGRMGRALAGWSASALLGIGVVGGAAIAALSVQGVHVFSNSALWWVFLQACSLPAVMAAGLLITLVRALRGRQTVQHRALRVAAPAR